MLILSRALLIIALLIAATIARSEGIYNPTAGGWFSFTGWVGGGGAISNSSGGGVAPVSCASTGVFDLSNVCNDIYFIGALK